MIRRYQDISHFRAPYKDAWLSGFGADSPTMRTYDVAQGANGAMYFAPTDHGRQEAVDVLSTVYLTGPLPTKAALSSGEPFAAEMVSSANAIAGKFPFNTKEIHPFREWRDAALAAGFAVLVPVKFDAMQDIVPPEQRGGRQFVYAVRPDKVPFYAGPQTGLAVIYDAKKPGMSIAAIAGWSAVGLLAVTAIAMAAKKRR